MKRSTHDPISTHGPAWAKCSYCGKALKFGGEGEHCPTRAKVEAAKHLREAAPDLLAALEGLLAFAEAAETKMLVGDEGCLWPVEGARAAIAMAKGGAT